MSKPMNRYKADLREIRFLLFEQFRLQELLGTAPFKDWGREDVDMVLDEAYRWVCEVTGSLNRIGDVQGCKLTGGKVTAPPGFREAWKSLYEAGWRSLGKSPEHGAPW